MASVVKSITFDPSKLTNFLNAQKEAAWAVKELNRTTPWLHGTMRSVKDRIDIVRYYDRKSR